MTDRLEHYETILKIVLQIYDQSLQSYTNVVQMREFANQQLRDYLPRLIYTTRFLFDHNNTLAPTKLDLVDYFTDDPAYKFVADTPIEFPKLQFEFVEPTLLSETYTDLCKNGVHKKELQ